MKTPYDQTIKELVKNFQHGPIGDDYNYAGTTQSDEREFRAKLHQEPGGRRLVLRPNGEAVCVQAAVVTVAAVT